MTVRLPSYDRREFSPFVRIIKEMKNYAEITRSGLSPKSIKNSVFGSKNFIGYRNNIIMYCFKHVSVLEMEQLILSENLTTAGLIKFQTIF